MGNNLYTAVGSDYDALVQELSGELGDADVSEALGLDQLGFNQLGAVDDEELGALVKRALTKVAPRAAATATARGVNQAQLLDMIKKVVARNDSGFGILAKDVGTPEGAFGMAGSMNLLSFSGSVPANGSLSLPNVTLDRKSTIRELRAEQASTAIRVTSFAAAALPFGALRFPFSLASFGPNVQDRRIRAVTYDASVNFQLTVSNPTGAAIDLLLEAWGTPG